MTKPNWRLPLLTLLLASSAAFAQSGSDKAARFYEDALQRYERKDIAGAIIQLKNALQVDKNLLPVHVLLGKALLANSEVAAAEFEFSEALRLGVNRAEVVVPLAKALVAQGKQAAVISDQRLKTTDLPAAIQLQLLLVRATAASDMGDTRGALQAVQEARAIDPREAGTWLAEVPPRIRARQYVEAMAAADQAIKLAPDMSEAYYQKGSILHVQGQIQAALSAYDRAIKLDSGHVEARLARAGIALDQGRDKEAQADVNELLLLAQADPRGNYLRALLAERAGDAATAKAALKEVTELLDPVPIEFIRYRTQILILNGLAHYGLNEFENAKPYLELALRQQPGSPLNKLLAQISLAEPNIGHAVELLENYLKVQPGDGQALVMLAAAHMTQGRHAKATALMQEALRAKDSPAFRTYLGLSLMRGGRGGNATEELERAYKADPKQSYAGMALVGLYLRNGQIPKALSLADSLTKSNPNNPSMLILQAMAKSRGGDVNGARASYEKALKLDPKLLEPKLGLARLDITSKSFEAAEKRLKTLLRNDERNVDVLFELALLNEMRGKPDEALKWLEGAADASNQRETRANYALVTWHLRKGEPAKALDAAKILLAKLPEDVEALRTYASAQIANGDRLGAKSTLTNASRRAAFNANAQVEIARAQMQVQDLAGAAYSLEKALTESPDNLPAMALMSTVELMQGDAAKAEKRAQQIIQQRPKLAIGYGLLADVAMARGQLPAALDALRRAHDIERSNPTMLRLFTALSSQSNPKPAIDLAESWLKTKPGDLVVHKALANLQVRSGNFAGARRSYEAALKLQPNDGEALNNLANVLLHQKEPGAMTIAEKALAQDPRNAIYLDTAGWANHMAGNKDRALQLLRDARLRAPGSSEIRYHLAAALAKSGRNAEARTELEAALKGGGSFESAQEARTLLGTLK